MVSSDQVDYIRQQLAAGVERGDLIKALMGNGWGPVDIDDLFARVSVAPVVASPATMLTPVPSAPGPMPMSPPPALASSKGMMVVAAIVLLVGGGVATYAYVQKIGPFAHPPYAEDNLISGLLSSATNIQTSSYAFSGSLAVGPRDEGVTPFAPSLSEDGDKPFLAKLGESMRMLPAELAVSISIAATSAWTDATADWKFNMNVTGDFGDLSFKVDADALKKDKIYYFRINNIPSLVGAYFSSIKGQWVKADPDSPSLQSSSYYNEFKSLIDKIPELEKDYKENREDAVEAFKKIVRVADETRFLTFVRPPQSEKVDGRLLYRYEVEMRKDSAIAFYKKMAEEALTDARINNAKLFNDPEMIEYLESEEFAEVLDYYNQYTDFTIWVDPAGFPAIVQFTMRVIPPDTATQLAEKQINITWKLTISDVNVPVQITAPEDAKPIEEVIEQVDKNSASSKSATKK